MVFLFWVFQKFWVQKCELEVTSCYQFDLEMTLRLTQTFHQLIPSYCHKGEVQIFKMTKIQNCKIQKNIGEKKINFPKLKKSLLRISCR